MAWEHNPADRPTASEMVKMLAEIKVPQNLISRMAKACGIKPRCIRGAWKTREEAHYDGIVCTMTMLNNSV
jgi:hypothetical protein